MILLKLEDDNLFMKQLFTTDLMDRFEVLKVEVKTSYTTIMDGRIQKDWFDSDEECKGDYLTWEKLKSVVFDLIKGNKTPLLLMIQFSNPDQEGNRGGLRLQYTKEELVVITEYSSAVFSLDKTKEREWDETCEKFLGKYR